MNAGAWNVGDASLADDADWPSITAAIRASMQQEGARTGTAPEVMRTALCNVRSCLKPDLPPSGRWLAGFLNFIAPVPELRTFFSSPVHGRFDCEARIFRAPPEPDWWARTWNDLGELTRSCGGDERWFPYQDPHAAAIDAARRAVGGAPPAAGAALPAVPGRAPGGVAAHPIAGAASAPTAA